MAGLRRICKMYGCMKIQGVMWVWDYAKDEPVLESEMPAGSERWQASERARFELMKDAYRTALNVMTDTVNRVF